MQTNLVTGGSGFLGSHLVETLAARGETVRAFVRPTSQIAHLKNLGVEFAYGDLRDRQSLKTALRGVKRVYHCAALASDWGDRKAFQAVNVTGLRHLLETSLEAGVQKFLHVSTTDVYGHPNYPADETAPYKQRGWHYGDTKIAGEQLAWTYYREHGLPLTVVRPVNIYGPRSTSFVLELAKLIRQGEMVQIGNGRYPAGLSYVTNVVDLILLAADHQNSLGQAYNAADGSDITWRQYMERLAKIIGVPAPKLVIPYQPAYFAGWVMEKGQTALRRPSRQD